CCTPGASMSPMHRHMHLNKAAKRAQSARFTLLWGVLRQLRGSEYPSLHSQTNTFVDRLEFHEHRGIEIAVQGRCVQINRDLTFLPWFDTSFCRGVLHIRVHKIDLFNCDFFW